MTWWESEKSGRPISMRRTSNQWGDVAGASVEDLLTVKGMTEAKAESLIEEAVQYVSERHDAEASEAETQEAEGEGSRVGEPKAEDYRVEADRETATQEPFDREGSETAFGTESPETSQVEDAPEEDDQEPKTVKTADE